MNYTGIGVEHVVTKQPYLRMRGLILIPGKPFIPSGPWTLEPGSPLSPCKPPRPTREIKSQCCNWNISFTCYPECQPYRVY